MTDALDALARFDTPTICNALELVVPESRRLGFTRAPVVAAPSFWRPPEGHRAICARARTVRIAASEPHGRSEAEHLRLKARYYEFVAASGPSIVVVEDVDPHPIGAFWGEVHSALHRALGAQGCVTNGVVRDLDDLDPGFLILAGSVGPSHAHVHWTDYGEGAEVFGLAVAEGAVVHADRHGAVMIPDAAVARLPEAVAEIQARERPLIELAREGGPVDLGRLRAILGADREAAE